MSNTIYIGYRLGKDGVMTNELFTDRPVELIARLSKNYPLIENLFVGVEDLAAAQLEVKLAGTLRNQAYLQTKTGGVENG